MGAELSGADIVVSSLRDAGVEVVFGYPGGAALHIYDAIYKQDDFDHILTRHEQGATHAADGYARSTGKPGVVIVTSGPGATNAVTGIATAYMDSIPMVIISGQVPLPLIGGDAFQEADISGITRPCVKHNFLVKKVEDIASTISKAFHIATTGRPGPVLIDIPKDITAQTCEYHYPQNPEIRSYQPKLKGNKKQVQKGADMILAAERPIIYTGGGVVLGNASAELTEMTRMLGYPITNTLMGLGAYPYDDAQFVGMLGMHGTYEANMAMHEADVIFAIGARFDDRITGDLKKFAPHAKIVHIDVDPSTISKNRRADVPIVGDAKIVIQQMIDELKKRQVAKQWPDKAQTEGWWKTIEEWRSKDSLWYTKSEKYIKPEAVVEVLHKITGGEAYIASDVGQHQMWAAQYYGFKEPRKWINSGGLGTMGFGLPAALGVKRAHPDADVACITGDGSIMMCIQELTTAKAYDLPVKIICLNNQYLGMVRQWQHFFYEDRFSEVDLTQAPDFVALAESFGHVGLRISDPAELEPTLKKVMAMKDQTVFLDIMVDPHENCYPMIPAGAGHAEMILRPEDEEEHK